MSGLNIDGIVFDFDGTLINLGGHVEWRKAQEEVVQGYIDQDCDEETVQACNAKGMFTMLDEMYGNIKDERGEEEARVIQASIYNLIRDYEVKGVDACVVMDGCPGTLDWISEKGVPMGILTANSAKSAEEALKFQGLRHHFKAVLGRSVDFPMKPHPAQLEECFRLIGADPSRGVMVGDSHKDIIAGKAAGAYTVGIPVYFTRLELMKEAGVDIIIDSLSELPAVLEGL